MIELKLLTTSELADIQHICERHIKTAIGNFSNGFGRMEDLYEVAKVMHMLTMCRGCDAEADWLIETPAKATGGPVEHPPMRPSVPPAKGRKAS